MAAEALRNAGCRRLCSSSTEAALQTLSYQHTGKAIFHFWKAEPASAAATAALADTNLLIYHKRFLHITMVWGIFRIFAADLIITTTMQGNFSYHNPTKLYFGDESLNYLKDELE